MITVNKSRFGAPFIWLGKRVFIANSALVDAADFKSGEIATALLHNLFLHPNIFYPHQLLLMPEVLAIVKFAINRRLRSGRCRP
jgi:hypothetical protein